MYEVRHQHVTSRRISLWQAVRGRLRPVVLSRVLDLVFRTSRRPDGLGGKSSSQVDLLALFIHHHQHMFTLTHFNLGIHHLYSLSAPAKTCKEEASSANGLPILLAYSLFLFDESLVEDYRPAFEHWLAEQRAIELAAPARLHRRLPRHMGGVHRLVPGPVPGLRPRN